VRLAMPVKPVDEYFGCALRLGLAQFDA